MYDMILLGLGYHASLLLYYKVNTYSSSVLSIRLTVPSRYHSTNVSQASHIHITGQRL